jgi:hypothetical protein
MVYKILYDMVYYVKYFISMPWGKKKAKKYILNGAALVPDNIAMIRRLLPKYILQLEKEKSLIRESYLQFLENQKTGKEAADYYYRYNPEFLSVLELQKASSWLAAESELSLYAMDTAFKKLLSETARRKRIKDEPPEIQRLELRFIIFNSKASKVQEMLQGKK